MSWWVGWRLVGHRETAMLAPSVGLPLFPATTWHRSCTGQAGVSADWCWCVAWLAGVWHEYGWEHRCDDSWSALEFQQSDFENAWIVGQLLVGTETVIKLLG